MLRPLLFLGPLALVGCVTPTSGDYLFEAGAVTTDCPESEDTGGEVENDPVGVKVSDDGTSVKIQGVDCPLDGNTFTCVYEPNEVDYSTYGTGLVAVATFTGSSTGTWVSNSKITGSSDYASTCEGADCGTTESDYGAVYCSSSTEYEANLQE